MDLENMTLEDMMNKVAEQEKMPDFENMKLKEGTTVEDCRKAMIGLATRCWESDKLLEAASSMLSGALQLEIPVPSLAEDGQTDEKMVIVTPEELSKRIDKHLGLE